MNFERWSFLRHPHTAKHHFLQSLKIWAGFGQLSQKNCTMLHHYMWHLSQNGVTIFHTDYVYIYHYGDGGCYWTYLVFWLVPRTVTIPRCARTSIWWSFSSWTFHTSWASWLLLKKEVFANILKLILINQLMFYSSFVNNCSIKRKSMVYRAWERENCLPFPLF